MFHGGIALLVLTLILYPYPKRIYDENEEEDSIERSNERFAIAIEFLNAYDVMDVVENVMCIQSYSAVWVVVFYIALAVSVILLAFPISLTEEDANNPQWGRIGSSVATLIFTDVAFAAIGGKVMFSEKSFQPGFNFFSKNLFAGICRACLIVKVIYNMCRRERE